MNMHTGKKKKHESENDRTFAFCGCGPAIGEKARRVSSPWRKSGSLWRPSATRSGGRGKSRVGSIDVTCRGAFADGASLGRAGWLGNGSIFLCFPSFPWERRPRSGEPGLLRTAAAAAGLPKERAEEQPGCSLRGGRATFAANAWAAANGDGPLVERRFALIARLGSGCFASRWDGGVRRVT